MQAKVRKFELSRLKDCLNTKKSKGNKQGKILVQGGVFAEPSLPKLAKICAGKREVEGHSMEALPISGKNNLFLAPFFLHCHVLPKKS